MSSIGSSNLDPRHLSLIQASAAGNDSKVRQIVHEAAWHSQVDRDALRQSLQRVSARGNRNRELAKFLIEKGADVNPRRDQEPSALFKAAEGGHEEMVKLLLQHNADTEAKDRDGRTALFKPALRGSISTVEALLAGGANTNARDKEGRTVLIHLAAEGLAPERAPPQKQGAQKQAAKKQAAGKQTVDGPSAAQQEEEKQAAEKLLAEKQSAEKGKLKGPGRWKLDMIQLLLKNNADIEAKDDTRRTALLWAAVTGKTELIELLLSGEFARPADVSASNNRGRTALHFAAEGNQIEVVRILLEHDADPRIESDGGWTPLHNACEKGHTTVVELLLNAEANVNAELFNGMTGLHWAAFNGHEDVVKLILTRPEANLAIKDTFDRTPMLCAAEKDWRDIVLLLSPGMTGSRLPPLPRSACESFDATVVDFGAFRDNKKQLVFKHSVYELLYGWNEDTNKPKVTTNTKNVRHQPAFRWIHLPANNINWMEALIAKSFTEGGNHDIEDFKALEKCFGQEHRGPTVHAHFMRTFCQHMAGQQKPEKQSRPEEPREVPLEDSAATLITVTPPDAVPNGEPSTPRRPPPSPTRDETPKSERKKSKSDQIKERHAKKPKKGDGQNANRNKGGDKSKSPRPTPKITPGSNGKIVLFMPFLHYETDERREKMAQAIKRASAGQEALHHGLPDETLIQAYLKGTPPLHTRRTLDQFFYHGIDTSDRDRDQVVYRYCKRRNLEAKIFMVDQLWLWVLGKELIVTSFPQRWQQPKNDPLNVLDGIIEDMNAKTRPPITSVYDLAMLITSRCCGMFDRHRMDDENYQFLDMFESSIGHVTNRETKLFARFNTASAAAAKWLKTHRRARGTRRLPDDRGPIGEQERDYDSDPIFVDALLDIGVESELLAEIKDIRDELNIIAMVLQYQGTILPELAENVTKEVGKNSTEALEIVRRKREQLKVIDVHIKDVERMDKQAQGIYTSLTHLLDLKQKHANAFEARFARDQAALTAHQGQTILVFTIVTVIFLPISFVAAFFAINIEEFPRTSDGTPSLHLSYVAKYMFGIGLGISVPLIVIALTVDDVGYYSRKAQAAIARLIFRRKHAEDAKRTELEQNVQSMLDAPRVSNIEKVRDRSVDAWAGRKSVGFERDFEGLSPPVRVNSRNTQISWARASYDRVRGRHSDDLERGRALGG